jgi:serine peptidase DegS
MTQGSLHRNRFFIAGSVAAGVLIAYVAVRLWPGLLHRESVGNGAVTALAPVPIPPVTTVAAPSDDLQQLTQTVTAGPDAQAPSTEASFATAVRASAPAVVSIYTRRIERVPASPVEQLMGGPARSRYRESLGSGVIVDAQGHIVTNHHVIASSSAINVQLADGRSAEARVVGRDPDTDLAVLKIDLPQLPVMRMGRADRVAVGDIVLAIGNPLGLTQTVTHGIVSATGRSDLGVAVYEDFIQTDAAINEGNSGGALVNTRGELIGINTAVLGKDNAAEGLGIAIPVDLVRGVMREILQHQRVIRGWIGIDVEDVPPQVAQAYGLPHAGVAVSTLYRSSPAVAAGLAFGDMIEAIDGQPVRSAQDTRARIASRKPGSKVRLTGMRGQQKFTTELPVVEAPQLRQ